MSFIFIVIALIFTWMYIKKMSKPFRKLRNLKLKEPNYLKFYGNALKYIFEGFKINPKDFYENFVGPNIREKFDCIWFGPNFFSLLHNPEDVKIVLNSKNCFEKAFLYQYIFKTGLITIGGEKYKQQRKSLNPIFAPANLRVLIPTINEKSMQFFNDYSRELEMENIDFKLLISKFSLNTVCETIMGIDGSNQEVLKQLIENTEEFLLASSERMFKPQLYFNFLYKKSSIFKIRQKFLDSFKKLVDEHMKIDNEFSSYFSCMENLNSEMSKDEFLESIAVFFFASFESTARTISSAILLLSMNPKEQEKVYNEITSILSSFDEEVTEEKFNQMHYLELVIKETLRLFPIVLLQLRTATDDIKLTKFTAPKGSTFVIPTLELHRFKSIWGEDALEFKPERFTEENMKNIHPYAFIPFSQGPRMCPGYKYAMITLKIFLSKFIMKYQVSTKSKFDELKFFMIVSPTLQKTPKIHVEKRF